MLRPLLQGVLKGYDQCINVVLDDSFERVYSTKEPVEAVELGLYIVRGDNMCVLAGADSRVQLPVYFIEANVLVLTFVVPTKAASLAMHPPTSASR